MDNTVNITGIPKAILLEALWNNMKPAAFFTMSGLPSPQFDRSNARNATNDYIDYYCGRCIKTDLSGDTVCVSAYDRDAGAGAFARIVCNLRRQLAGQ